VSAPWRWPSPRVEGGPWLLALLVLSLAGCSREVVPSVMAGVDDCAHCHMVIDQVNQASGYIRDRGFVTFDSPACLLARFEELRKAGETLPRAIFFADFSDGSFHSAESTTFLLTSHRPTVMGGEVLSFGSRVGAQQIHEHDDEVLTDWVGYRTARGQPDRQVVVSLGPDGLSPERIEVEKGDLVAWTITATGESPERTPVLKIKGYPEVDPVAVAADEPASFRLLASRPGDGFPIVEDATGEVLGVVVVRGAHTADEEAEEM
jgi:hypothetical protein